MSAYGFAARTGRKVSNCRSLKASDLPQWSVDGRADPTAGRSGSDRVRGRRVQTVQCFAASTGYALSGCLVCGAAQCGTASGCRRRRTITIAPPQAQRQTGRRGEVDVGGGAADGRRCNTCSRRKLRRLLWCRKPKFLARTNPLGKMCCSRKSGSHTGFPLRLR